MKNSSPKLNIGSPHTICSDGIIKVFFAGKRKQDPTRFFKNPMKF